MFEMLILVFKVLPFCVSISLFSIFREVEHFVALFHNYFVAEDSFIRHYANQSAQKNEWDA